MPCGLLWVWIKFGCPVPSLLSHHNPLTNTHTHKNSIAEFEEIVAVNKGSSFAEWQTETIGRQEKHVSANGYGHATILWLFCTTNSHYCWSNSCCNSISLRVERERQSMCVCRQWINIGSLLQWHLDRTKSRAPSPGSSSFLPPTDQQLSHYNPSIASTWCPVLFVPAKLFSLALFFNPAAIAATMQTLPRMSTGRNLLTMITMSVETW